MLNSSQVKIPINIVTSVTYIILVSSLWGLILPVVMFKNNLQMFLEKYTLVMIERDFS